MNGKPTYEELLEKVKELQKSLESYRTLVETSQDLFYRTDLEGKISYISPSVYRLSGYTVEEVIGMNMAQEVYLYPEERNDFLAQLRAEGQIAHFEARLKRKDGSIWWASTNAHFYKDLEGNILGVEGITRDITERKQAELALQENETRLRTIFDLSPAGIILVDPKGIITYANQGMTKMFGYTQQELIGLPYPNLVHPYQRNIGDQRMRQLIGHEIDSVSYERHYIRADGTDFYGFLSGRRHEDNQGKLISLVGIITDISDQKMLEEQLRQASKMESIGTLAGGIAHEFNNMLGIIIGNAELAKDNIPEWSPAVHSIEEIRKASLRATDIVRKLLSFARKSPSSRKPMQIRPVVEETLDLLRKTIATTIDIRRDFSCTTETILADPTEIGQVLMNLCSNAAQAMVDGTGVIDVRLEAVHLDSHMADRYENIKSGDYAILTVTDSGMGIEPSVMERIFDPYFTTKNIDEGLGMGLAIVHGIVKKHDGTIAIKSSVGAGTTAKVLFPLISEQPAPKSQTADDVPSGTERILLVEDEASLLGMVKQMIERCGYEVHAESNSVEALKIFQENPKGFDIVITDMAMPHMSGDRLASELIRIRPDIPVILCTGYSDRIDEKKARALGIKSFIMKPFSRHNLAGIVRKVLDDEKRTAQD
ncbi:MAG: PAS domain S-box protein [Thermodesulfobacteriota bacterium]